VLVLPNTSALSAEEAQAIRRFAEGGGTVIADVRPGIFDEHCKAISPGRLDDLFGIVRTGRGKGAVADLTVAAEFEGKSLSGSFPRTHVDTEVRAAEAPAQDSPPALLIRRVGQGRAILLNFQLNRAGKDDPITTASRGLLRGLYDLAGAESPAAVTAPDGGPLPVTEARQWRTGNGLLLGMWRRMENAWFAPTGGVIAGPPQPTRVTFGGKRHVYDLRAGKYLGAVSSLDTKLQWGRASFYLALPYQITGLEAAVSAVRPQRGQTLTASLKLRASGKVTERLPVWVEVTDPAGNRPLWGRQTVLLQGGAAAMKLPMAYNDQPGKWRLRATELFSGRSAEAAWVVQ
jgi:beta-galactosidase